MSRYEIVCDLLRQRRAEAEATRERQIWFDGEEVTLAVVQDALCELGLLFEPDAEECGRLARGQNGTYWQRHDCILVQQKPTAWPLQSELDA